MTILDYIEFFVDWVMSPRVSGNLFAMLWVLVIGSGFLEFSKLKISPWTWVAKKVGKVLNAEVFEELKAVNKRLGDIEDRQDKFEHQTELNETLEARRRILRINSELLLGRDIDREYLHNVMHDIAAYEDYCKAHSDVRDPYFFSNEECPEAIRNIREYYTAFHKRLQEKARNGEDVNYL